MTSYLVAIDNGSQSTKVLIVDEAGRVHASARVGLRPYAHPAAGQAVHPDDDLWTSIATACRVALSRFTGDRNRIAGVGLCTIRYCRALLDARGDLVEPVWSWMDDRVSLPYVPADERVSWVTTSTGYLAHRLTGHVRDAAGNCQGMWPIDQESWGWSGRAEDYQRTGLTRDLLCGLVEPSGVLGEITEAASAATGLPMGLQVFATSNDKAVEALGAGSISPTTVLLSLGTYVAAMTPTERPGGGSAHWVNFGAQPGRYLAESAGIRRGMWTVSWFRALLQGESDSAADDLYALEAELDRAARTVSPGCDGLRAVLDWLAPPSAPTRRGALLGFTTGHGRAHIYRAILEGLAFEMADNIEAMLADLGRDAAEIVLTGGGARSQVLPQTIADLLGLPVRRAGVDDAAGIGAAISAAVGAGVHPGWDAAIAAMTRPGDRTQPSPGRTGVSTLRDQHRQARRGVRELSALLAD